MDKKIDTLYDLCEMTFTEIERTKRELESAGGELNEQHIEYVKDLVETMKYIKCIISMIEDENGGYSGNYYYEDDSMRSNRNSRANRSNAYARRSEAYERGRSNRGRYSRGESKEDLMYELEEIIDKFPDEHTRKKFERIMEEMK